MAFATTADLVLCYDWRRLGELLSDDGTTPSDVSEVIDSAVAEEMLSQAYGEILAACRVGQRYTRQMLADLVLQSVDSAAQLRRLNCDIAAEYICARRMLSADETAKFSPRVKLARQMLQQLRDGERILDDLVVADAGAHTEALDLTMQIRAVPLLTSYRRLYGTQSSVPPWSGFQGGPGGWGNPNAG